MSRRTAVLLAAFAVLGIGVWASGILAPADGHRNLRVLADSGPKINAGMRSFSKGLGAKCSACHLDDEPDSDDKPAKRAARVFLSAVKDGARSDAKRDALAALLRELGRDAPADEAALRSAFAEWGLGAQ